MRLAYDPDCGPCRRFARAVEFLDWSSSLGLISLADADSLGLLDSVPPQLRYRSFHIIDGGSGEVQSGAEAIPSVVGSFLTGPLLSKALMAVPGLMGAVSFVYAGASRLHGRGQCAGPAARGPR